MGPQTAELTDLLQQMIRNRCVNDGQPDSGNEQRNVDVLDDFLGGAGLDVEIYESAPGRANLVARLEGSEPGAASLLYMGHTDVVPANEDQWTHDPYAAELIDGEIWGRGAIDMLNLTVAMAATMRRLAESGWKPKGTLVFMAVADEEAGGTYGAKFMADEHADVIKTDYCITETGGLRLPGGDGERLIVATAEKGTIDCRLKITGTPGHASQPYKRDNAIVKAAQVVQRIDEYRPQLKLGEQWHDFIESMGWPDEASAPLLDPERVMQTIDAAPDSMSRALQAACHTTFAPTILKGGDKLNVIPDTVELDIDIRTLPGDAPEAVRAMLDEALGDLADSVEIIRFDAINATASPLKSELWESVTRAVAKIEPGAKLAPYLSVGATDNRFIRPMDTVGYGFALFSKKVGMDDFSARFHGNDERIDVDSLDLTNRIYEQIARDLLE